MKTFEFSNKINANKTDVFKIMLDIHNYNTWNKSLHYKSGKMQINNSLLLEASLDGEKFIKWSCKVEEINENNFVLSKSFISKYYMHMKHYFIVTEIDDNSCEVKHKWIGTGISPLLFWSKIVPVMLKFKAYNDSLSKYIENENQ